MTHKVKHKKQKNTGLVYFTTVKKITEAACSDQTDLSKRLVKALVKSFKKAPLKTEMEIYQAVVNEYLSPTLGSKEAVEKFIGGLLDLHKGLDSELLAKQRNNLITEVNRVCPVEEVLMTRIDNLTYKLLASTFVVLQSAKRQTINETKDFVLLYDKLFRMLSEAQNRTPQQGNINGVEADKLIVRLMIEKFNQKYRELSKKQKEILREYIQYVFDEEGNKEFPIRLHTIIETACDKTVKYQTLVEDKDTLTKIDSAVDRTKNKEEWPLHQLVQEALQYVELLETIESN